MTCIKRLIGYFLFLPFIFFYSFVLGPILIAVLVPGGLALLVLILGYKDWVLALKKAIFSSGQFEIKSVAMPKNLRVTKIESGSVYHDTFEFNSMSQCVNAKQAYFAIFGYLPKSVQRLLKLRNWIVSFFGFNATNTQMSSSYDDIETGKQAGFLRYTHVSKQEVVSFAEEPNIAIWLSLKNQGGSIFTVSTFVSLKTKRGKIYMTLIKPFHRFVAPYCIRSALVAGRI